MSIVFLSIYWLSKFLSKQIDFLAKTFHRHVHSLSRAALLFDWFINMSVHTYSRATFRLEDSGEFLL